VKIEPSVSPTNVGAQDEASAAESKTSESLDGMSENIKPEEGKKASGDNEDGDDINDISDSRTFLAKVCCKATTIHWLELAEYEGSDAPVPMRIPDPAYMNPAQAGMPVQPVDPNHPQYYHSGMGYAAQQHQNALKNHQQYFFQMQQRHQHQYAAQQAAWQAHYNQQPQMPPMHGQPPLTPPPAQAPPLEGSPAPAPVTAGEAAAQQQKRNRQMAEEGGGQPSPPPPPHAHGPPPPGQHSQGQQQQWMLYQQMYQAQVPPPMDQHSPYPPRQGQPTDSSGQGVHGVMMPNNDQHYNNAPATPEGNGKPNHEADSKRQRLV
jgi:hypothetical protein